MSNPMRGPRANIERAKKDLVNLIKVEISPFMGRDPYGIVRHCDLSTREEIFSIRVSEDVPDDILTGVGNVIGNLRAALDLLAGKLKYTGAGPAIERHEFPNL
jgi:hypothetical protein